MRKGEHMGGLKNFVIMLDDELRTTPGQWPIRDQSDDLNELRTRTRFDGNPQTIPRSQATIAEQPVAMTELIHNVTKIPHPGGIYQVLG